MGFFGRKKKKKEATQSEGPPATDEDNAAPSEPAPPGPASNAENDQAGSDTATAAEAKDASNTAVQDEKVGDAADDTKTPGEKNATDDSGPKADAAQGEQERDSPTAAAAPHNTDSEQAAPTDNTTPAEGNDGDKDKEKDDTPGEDASKGSSNDSAPTAPEGKADDPTATKGEGDGASSPAAVANTKEEENGSGDAKAKDGDSVSENKDAPVTKDASDTATTPAAPGDESGVAEGKDDHTSSQPNEPETKDSDAALTTPQGDGEKETNDKKDTTVDASEAAKDEAKPIAKTAASDSDDAPVRRKPGQRSSRPASDSDDAPVRRKPGQRSSRPASDSDDAPVRRKPGQAGKKGDGPTGAKSRTTAKDEPSRPPARGAKPGTKTGAKTGTKINNGPGTKPIRGTKDKDAADSRNTKGQDRDASRRHRGSKPTEDGSDLKASGRHRRSRKDLRAGNDPTEDAEQRRRRRRHKGDGKGQGPDGRGEDEEGRARGKGGRRGKKHDADGAADDTGKEGGRRRRHRRGDEGAASSSGDHRGRHRGGRRRRDGPSSSPSPHRQSPHEADQDRARDGDAGNDKATKRQPLFRKTRQPTPTEGGWVGAVDPRELAEKRAQAAERRRKMLEVDYKTRAIARHEADDADRIRTIKRIRESKTKGVIDSPAEPLGPTPAEKRKRIQEAQRVTEALRQVESVSKQSTESPRPLRRGKGKGKTASTSSLASVRTGSRQMPGTKKVDDVIKKAPPEARAHLQAVERMKERRREQLLRDRRRQQELQAKREAEQKAAMEASQRHAAEMERLKTERLQRLQARMEAREKDRLKRITTFEYLKEKEREEARKRNKEGPRLYERMEQQYVEQVVAVEEEEARARLAEIKEERKRVNLRELQKREAYLDRLKKSDEAHRSQKLLVTKSHVAKREEELGRLRGSSYRPQVEQEYENQRQRVQEQREKGHEKSRRVDSYHMRVVEGDIDNSYLDSVEKAEPKYTQAEQASLRRPTQPLNDIKEKGEPSPRARRMTSMTNTASRSESPDAPLKERLSQLHNQHQVQDPDPSKRYESAAQPKPKYVQPHLRGVSIDEDDNEQVEPAGGSHAPGGGHRKSDGVTPPPPTEPIPVVISPPTVPTVPAAAQPQDRDGHADYHTSGTHGYSNSNQSSEERRRVNGGAQTHNARGSVANGRKSHQSQKSGRTYYSSDEDLDEVRRRAKKEADKFNRVTDLVRATGQGEAIPEPKTAAELALIEEANRRKETDKRMAQIRKERAMREKKRKQEAARLEQELQEAEERRLREAEEDRLRRHGKLPPKRPNGEYDDYYDDYSDYSYGDDYSYSYSY